jgi:NitT/TauT family transport system ATP-binding protein
VSQGTTMLKLEGIEKFYAIEGGLKAKVLQDINFEIKQPERATVTTILAPFGSGKTTLLKIISGIVKPTSGRIFLEGSHIDYQKTKLPFIPEAPSSFPWLNVSENIRFALNLQTNSLRNIEELISLTGLTGYEEHFPHNKSLGFRFRISLARALAINPPFILIDDSLENIKQESKEELYEVLIKVSDMAKQNFILATTNVVEAIQLSDEIHLMSKTPAKIFHTIKIGRKDAPLLKKQGTEKFNLLKDEIEEAFKSVQSIKTINYSL